MSRRCVRPARPGWTNTTSCPHCGTTLATGGSDQATLAGAVDEAVRLLTFAGSSYGSASGLTTAGGQLFTQVGGTVEALDQFGAQLATGDFNNNGFADLAAAAPAEAVGSVVDASAVSVLWPWAGWPGTRPSSPSSSRPRHPLCPQRGVGPQSGRGRNRAATPRKPPGAAPPGPSTARDVRNPPPRARRETGAAAPGFANRKLLPGGCPVLSS
jgi:FG-GAP repeat